eukprot:778219-Pyramimonas_sp.AAC.1
MGRNKSCHLDCLDQGKARTVVHSHKTRAFEPVPPTSRVVGAIGCRAGWVHSASTRGPVLVKVLVGTTASLQGTTPKY